MKACSFPALNSTKIVNSLYRVSLKTGTGDDCSMDLFGGAFVTIDGMKHEHCQTPELDHSGDDFEEGQTDTYVGEALGECAEIDFTNGIFQFTVHHSGSDGWCFEEGEVELRDGTVVPCIANTFLDDGNEFVCPSFKLGKDEA